MEQPLPESPREAVYRIVLAIGERTITATLSCDASAPVVLQIERPADRPARWRYVGLRVPNFVGMKVSVIDLTVDGR